MAAEPRVAFIGLGAMGTPMSRRLVEAGCAVTGYDPQAGATQRAKEHGVMVADSAAAAAAAGDVVILMLPDSDVVESVALAPGFAGALPAGATLVDMSSSEPARTRDLAAHMAEKGVAVVDAPVSGGVAGAESGNLTIMVGGADDAVTRVEGVLGHLGRVVRVGPVGNGHAVKALNNLLSATHLLATAEAMAAGERFGLDPAVLLDAINGSSGRSGSTENKWPRFVLPGTFDSGFALSLMLKDMRIAVALADQLGSPIALGRDAARLWGEAAEALDAAADHTEVARWVDQLGESGEGLSDKTPDHGAGAP